MDTGPVMIVDSYFQRVREAVASQTVATDDTRFAIRATELIAIAGDPRSRSRFRQAYAGINDPDVKALIRDQLRQVAIALEDQSKGSDARVELVDRGGFMPSASVAAAITVALLMGTVAVSPLLLIPVGAAMSVSAIGRHRLKMAAVATERQAKEIRALLEYIGP
ncbi:MAG: hypothetical protein CFE37_05245 [Alphaproteobacteria bacterium PA4]|nr:MAG: hypothetical protein CFE37_05245 [Alphaproteobacteria bacterium PA4]